MKVKLTYEGPLKGKIRFLLNRHRIEKVYYCMLDCVNNLCRTGETLEDAICETNRIWEHNDFGLYLYNNGSVEPSVPFAFVDCEMKDCGYYEIKVPV